uniref:THAP-type domain-containing protein n=1 Tax=Ciona savignyi TaxID=51511 RepID=H2ZCA2_CIOSA
MPGPNSKLCQHHFEPHHFSTVVHARGKGLKPTAVPTKFIHNSNCEKLQSRHKKLPDKICIEIETDDFFFNQRSIMGASQITHEHDTDIQTDTTNWIDGNLKMTIELAPKTEPADQMENNLQVAVKVPRKR